GADPIYDPALVQGLQITEQSVTHVASHRPSPTARELPFSAPENMRLWADWVRSSIYVTDFLRHFDWRINDRSESVTLSYGRRDFVALRRPSMETFKQQLDIVRTYLDQRPDRTPEVITQLSFPTPYFAMIVGLQT